MYPLRVPVAGLRVLDSADKAADVLNHSGRAQRANIRNLGSRSSSVTSSTNRPEQIVRRYSSVVTRLRLHVCARL
jgi:hypothetical protein